MKCVLTGLHDMHFKMNGEEIDGVKLHYTNGLDPNVKGRVSDASAVCVSGLRCCCYSP
jgi:hypothetical protein